MIYGNAPGMTAIAPCCRPADPYAKLNELFQQRDPLYQQVSDIVVQSGKQSVHALMLNLIDKIDTFRKSCHGN